MRIRNTVTLLASSLALTACLNDNGGRQFIDVETSDAGRCEILDQANCLFPFPSNAYLVEDESTDTGWRVNLNIDSMPRNKQDVPVDPAEWNRNDGFSPSQMIVTQVPGLDLDQTGAPRLTDLAASLSADSPVQVIRASTGERHLIFSELDANTDNPEETTFLIRPQAQFERGERYIVALSNLRDANGDLIEPPEVFRVLRDGRRTSNQAIEARRDGMEEIFDILEDAGIDRDGLYLAWDFNVASVRNITERVLHIRDEAFADLGAAAPVFRVSEVIDFAPCGDDGCGDGENELMSREVNGFFTVPNFLDTDLGEPGAAFYYAEGDELPDRMGGDNTLQANFICRIARSTVADYDVAPAEQARPSLYGHGLLGSAGEVRRGTGGNINIMSSDHNMMFCATDWAGFSGEDVGVAIEALQDMTHLRPFFDRTQQGLLNFMFLGRLLKHDDGFAAHEAFQAGGVPVFDSSVVYYDGNSQGGILGGALMGVIQDVTRGVLGVPGMNYSLLLRRSIDFEQYSLIFTGSATGPDGGGYTSVKDQTILLSMAQMLWDRAEANGYAYHIENNTLPNTPSHSVLLQVAYGDHQVSHWAAELMTRAIGAKLRVPALEPGRHPDTNPFVNIDPLPAGVFTGSVLTYWDDGPVGGGGNDGGTAPPPTNNTSPFEPDFGEDPHSLPRKDPNAQAQKSAWLMPDGIGAFVDTCDPTLPCTVDGYVPGGP